MAKIQICLLQAPDGQTGRNGAMNKPRNIGLEDVQSNLSLTRVITAKLPLHVFSGYRRKHFPPKIFWLRHEPLQFPVLQNTGSQIQQGKLLKPFSGQLCLMLAGSMPGVSGISPSPIPLFDFADPNWDMGNHILSPGTPPCPVLTLPDIPAELGGFIYRHRSSKRFCTFLLKKQTCFKLQMSRPFSYSSCSASWATRAVNLSHHFVGNLKGNLYNLQFYSATDRNDPKNL